MLAEAELVFGIMAVTLPDLRDFETRGPVRENALQQLSNWITDELSQAFNHWRSHERPRIASALVEKVETLVEELNAAGFSFGRIDYGGDMSFEGSYQTFGSGERMGTGIILEFQGFACKVSWEDQVDDA